METSVGTDEIAVWGTAAEGRSAENTDKESVSLLYHHSDFKPILQVTCLSVTCNINKEVRFQEGRSSGGISTTIL